MVMGGTMKTLAVLMVALSLNAFAEYPKVRPGAPKPKALIEEEKRVAARDEAWRKKMAAEKAERVREGAALKKIPVRPRIFNITVKKQVVQGVFASAIEEGQTQSETIASMFFVFPAKEPVHEGDALKVSVVKDGTQTFIGPNGSESYESKWKVVKVHR